ncbi:mitochondrial inner-membrane-bound regulator-domain-containing protein [Clohesyomyces aquaticus]|uniref:Mitochondrial inner-membrane-bound regulator-domain-containing protein n=1 Tax=Clohesyomyces aquaticus TaxID=1231657 RepID=A0A1Y1YWD9_9PLEO|nr:mitochondrial inner-membrane-bound regulator-domain-containing protein [Clohesyomyces aquaticus]
MLAPRTSSAFVCLRCELKLAQSRAPVVSRIRPRAHFSVSAHRRDAFDDALAPAKLAPINPRPLGKLRKRKGKSIRETTAPLGVKTLGNDAEIIVLRELAEEAPEEKAAATEPAPDTPEDLGILASLQEEGKKLEQSDVNQQLEKLRPKTHEHPDEPHYISLAEFVQAKKALESGFNVKQLTQYFSILTGIERSKVKRKVTEGIQGTRANPITRTDWHPGTSQLNTRLPGAGARMRDSKRRSISKRLLVDKILRDGWHLVLLEEIEAPGELEICLNRWHISVLNAGETPTILDEVGNARKAKIEIHWPDSILRITADKSSAEYAADDIQNYLANTEVEVVSLNPWRRFVPKGWSHGPKLSNWLSPQVIETVEKQSGAVIEPLDRSEVQIRAVDKSRVMEAKRLLIGMLPLEDASARVVRSQAFVVEARNCYLLPTAFQTSLGYRQKGLHLGRWSLPVLRLSDNVQPEEGEPEDAQSPPKPKGMEPILDRFRGQIIKALEPTPFLPPRKPAKGKYVVWENPTTRIYADYGHVLVPMDTVLQPSFRLSNTPFLNCLPGLAKMMHSTEERPLVGAFLEYQFVLSPHQDFNFDVPPEEHPYPKLFIRVKLRDDGKPVLRGVAIEFNESVFDAVLPDRAVDIRFQHVQRVWLKDPLDIPGIREYIEAIEANIESGARLTAPPEITIDVPRWAVQGVDDMIRYPVRNLPTTYLFLRVRHQQIGRKWWGIKTVLSDE